MLSLESVAYQNLLADQCPQRNNAGASTPFRLLEKQRGSPEHFRAARFCSTAMLSSA